MVRVVLRASVLTGSIKRGRMTDSQAEQLPAATLLVIEDDQDTLDFYTYLLTAAGYRLLVAATGRGGLAHVATVAVDGVVLDRRLPDMDGLQVCRLLRDQLGASVPILLVSADKDPTLAAAAREA